MKGVCFMKKTQEFYAIIKLLSTVKEKDKIELLNYLRSLQDNADNSRLVFSGPPKDSI